MLPFLVSKYLCCSEAFTFKAPDMFKILCVPRYNECSEMLYPSTACQSVQEISKLFKITAILPLPRCCSKCFHFN